MVTPLVVTAILCCATPAPAQVRHEYTEIHMGMPVRMVLHAPDDSTARAAARAAFATVARLENVFSDYRAFSELRQLEVRAGEWIPVSDALFAVLERALVMARATAGAFDPTVGPLTSVWRDARRRGKAPADSLVLAARQLVDWRNLEPDPARRQVRLALRGMRLDVGGIAKGYILEQALLELSRRRVVSALIEAGGDVVVGAAPPGAQGWSIAVPEADSAFRTHAASLAHASLATSGSTYQYLEIEGVRHSHVIDPRTGTPLTSALTVHVIADDAMTADALATALTVLGAAAVPRLRELFPGVHVMVVPERR